MNKKTNRHDDNISVDKTSITYLTFETFNKFDKKISIPQRIFEYTGIVDSSITSRFILEGF